MDSNIVLNALTEEDARLLDERLFSKDSVGEYQWFGFRTHGRRIRRYQEDGLIGERDGEFGIRKSGELVGVIDWRRISWGPKETSWCWELGITLLATHRGSGIGSTSLNKMAAYLFANTPANRVQASTDISNIAARRALEKADFRWEGIVRGAQWRRGEWHDVVLYAVLRSDP